MTLTRDSFALPIGAIAFVVTGLTASFGLFPWIPLPWQHGLSLAGFILSSVCTYLSTSPLRLSPEGKMKALGDSAPNSGKAPIE